MVSACKRTSTMTAESRSQLSPVVAPHCAPATTHPHLSCSMWMRRIDSGAAARWLGRRFPLRYREHLTGVEGDTHWLVVTAEDPNRVSARWLLRNRPGSAALTSVVEVTNISGDELILGALSSLR